MLCIFDFFIFFGKFRHRANQNLRNYKLICFLQVKTKILTKILILKFFLISIKNSTFKIHLKNNYDCVNDSKNHHNYHLLKIL